VSDVDNILDPTLSPGLPITPELWHRSPRYCGCKTTVRRRFDRGDRPDRSSPDGGRRFDCGTGRRELPPRIAPDSPRVGGGTSRPVRSVAAEQFDVQIRFVSVYVATDSRTAAGNERIIPSEAEFALVLPYEHRSREVGLGAPERAASPAITGKV